MVIPDPRKKNFMLFLRVSGAEDRALEAEDDFLQNFQESDSHV